MLGRFIPGLAVVLLLLGQAPSAFSQQAQAAAPTAITAPAAAQDGKQVQPVVSAPASAPAASEEKSEGVSIKPDALFTIPVFGHDLPFTNSMAMTWAVSILLVLGIRLSVGKPTIIPGKAQAVVETVISALRDLIEMIVGPKMIGKTFPILICLFTFILIQNWSGLLPGLGAIGIEHNGHITPFLRAGNADINMVFGLTLVHFVAWFYFVMRYAGPKALFIDLFGNKAPKGEVPTAMYIAMFFMFGLVGLIEVISLVFRNVSLPLRLFGNIFGGDNLMEHMTAMQGWFVPIPFYFMEVLVGFVQALVFTILVSVYIGQICNHSEEEHAH